MLDVMTMDVDQNLHEVRQALRRIVFNPQEASDRDEEREDTYVTMYWKSIDYHLDHQTEALSWLLLEEYCLRRLLEGAEQNRYKKNKGRKGLLGGFIAERKWFEKCP